MLYSCVLIIPAALTDKANALGEAMGWGPESYTVELSADGKAPATHCGLHSWVSPAFVALLTDAKGGKMPEGLKYPVEDFAAVVGGLITSVRADMAGHFGDVLKGSGLAIVQIAI